MKGGKFCSEGRQFTVFIIVHQAVNLDLCNQNMQLNYVDISLSKEGLPSLYEGPRGFYDIFSDWTTQLHFDPITPTKSLI